MEVRMINADPDDEKDILQPKLVFASQLVAHWVICDMGYGFSPKEQKSYWIRLK